MKTKQCTNSDCPEKNPQPVSNFRDRGDRAGKYAIKRSHCISCEKIYQEKNGEKIRERSKVWHRKNRSRVRDTKYKKLYGITLKHYREMLNSQDGKCAICSVPRRKFKQPLNVDHCHVTGKVRGLLCHKCNRGIGLFNDDTTRLEQVVAYIKSGEALQ